MLFMPPSWPNLAVSPVEAKLDRLFTRISGHMKLIGWNIFNPVWRPNAISAVIFTALAFQPILSVNSILQTYHSFEALVECVCVTCTGLQVITRSHFYLRQRDVFGRIVQDMRQQRALFGADRSDRIDRLFHRAEDRMILFYRVLYAVYRFSVVFVLFALVMPEPRKFGLPLPFQFPLLPPDASRTYWYFTFLYHVMLILVAIHHLSAIDGIIMMSFVCISTRIGVLRVLLTELDEKIGRLPWSGTEQLDADLDRIIELHRVTKQFARRTFNTFQMHFFSIFATDCIVICMCLNVILVAPKNSVYPLMAAAGLQLFVVCYFGSLLLIANDRLPDSVYDIQWYRMTNGQQKKVRFLLANAQPVMLMSAVFLPVNMTSFVRIAAEAQQKQLKRDGHKKEPNRLQHVHRDHVQAHAEDQTDEPEVHQQIELVRSLELPNELLDADVRLQDLLQAKLEALDLVDRGQDRHDERTVHREQKHHAHKVDEGVKNVVQVPVGSDIGRYERQVNSQR
uniref:Odorant receptor n=1 Tax=Anopheles farauti TaxID=69004 RepID=A0A182QMS3_9DIPT